MKRLAIILGLLMFAPAAFAGGTVLFMDDGGYVYPQQQQIQYDPTSTYYTTNGVYGNGLASSQPQKYATKTTKRVRIGNQKNDPNVYWNFGAVNFGSGFTTVGGGDKKF